LRYLVAKVWRDFNQSWQVISAASAGAIELRKKFLSELLFPASKQNNHKIT
jgi:hypothetical protein